METREDRGRQIAAHAKLKNTGALWLVPSQSSNQTYVVNTLAGTCTCPDHEDRRVKCKHIFAVEFSQTIETTADGEVITTETVKVTRKTYSQNWHAYNAAQCDEKATVQELLRGLCDGIVTPPHAGRGPKPIPLSDVTFAAVMKVFTTLSGRRASTDVAECKEDGHISRAPHFNSISTFLDKPETTALLTKLVEDSAAPLASIEKDFAVDSTGFSTSVYRRWYDHKYGREMREHTWIKAHVMTGVVTNVVTAVTITDGSTNDGPQFPGLVKTTDRQFVVREVSADKAYLTHDNLDAAEAVGAAPYIPFKSNSKAAGPASWRRMWGMFVYKQDEFLAAYHKRSNVESTFSSIKRKFGGAVRSKLYTAQVNEILCKCICHNLSCLVHAMHETGIKPSFNAEVA